MQYTPRQVQAFWIIAQHRLHQELAQQLLVNRLAAHGDERAIRSQLRDWEG